MEPANQRTKDTEKTKKKKKNNKAKRHTDLQDRDEENKNDTLYLQALVHLTFYLKLDLTERKSFYQISGKLEEREREKKNSASRSKRQEKLKEEAKFQQRQEKQLGVKH